MIQRTEATLTVPDNPAGRAFADLFAGGDIALHLTAVLLAGSQGTATPTVEHKVVIVAAGDHGVTAEGVSAYPSEVTPQMVGLFAVGRAAGAILDEGLADEIVASMIEGPR